MYNNVLPQLWMMVPQAERQHLAEVFGLNRTGNSEIRNNEVISDGYSVDDLRAITAEKMSAYIGSEETFPRAWELTCAKARSVLNPPVMEIATGGIKTVNEEVKPGDVVPVQPETVIKKIETKTYENKKSK